ncbi:MAG: AmmeMemoRadiSam system protein A [Candidatus Abyssobacteria bacterium SURF_17]|uniref:AmmeMemoRadiSam system protein A n=1 Tax=Candidatus Abyssobacteria bacterium SURF_17 TaxID=2093361 RepID=A0A419F2J3_9BACT|nr:MAG: AmmeMemoRadiSam system protein A [Candidatus Abyssubacteria bacterium SURF_17]
MDAPLQLLDDSEQQFVLDVARKTIIEYVTNGQTPDFASANTKFSQKRGAFVTLHEKSGALRGCIGYVEPIKPLLQTITDMAIACATRDPRFEPVTPDEFPNLDLEVSVLTPLEQIRDIGKIQVGKHGLMIRKGYYSGLLLPQVAAEFGWDRAQFLRETSRKAGLPGDAWKESDAKLYIFSAQVFGGSLL